VTNGVTVIKGIKADKKDKTDERQKNAAMGIL
jgi:hypothetical protein